MMRTRTELLAQLGTQRFDLLVIGGGIVGADIARDAAMRGLKVALIEQGDFASGTSSKTSKLIHGGLRYLEHGHLKLVAESLRERAILKTIAPAYVRPLSLLLPVYQGNARPLWMIRAGLTLYDVLAIGRNLRRHRIISPRRALALEPELRQDGLRGAGLYTDCLMDDARLCLLTILQAVGFGAVCSNYVRLRSLLRTGGRVCGGVGEDTLTGRTLEIQATVVVNATGPWSDGVRRLSDPGATTRLAPTKGIHLILPPLTSEALFAESRADRRMIFFLPFGAYTLVGTTETPVSGPLDELRADADEVGYLLDEVNRVLPGRHIDDGDVIATFAGARPLLAFSGTSTQASREHRIEEDRWGLVSVMGGKYTTARVMATQVVDYVVSRQRWRVDRCLTDQVSLLETVHPVSLDHWQALTRMVDPDVLSRLLTRYGAGTFHVLRLLAVDPQLGQPVCPHHEYLEAELVYGLQGELACTLTDLLARRTRIAWSSCQGLDLVTRVSELCQRYGGIAPEPLARQADEYHQFLAAGLEFRPVSTAGRVWSEASE